MKHIWMLFLLVSCFKTAEEIERNQMVDQMGVQLEQSAKLVAELTQQVTDLQTRLASTTGQLEEIDHKNQKTTAEQKQTMEQSITQLQEQVKVLSIQASENQKLLTSLQSELDSQKRYSQKVAKTLGKMAKDSRGPTIQEAHKFFEKNKLKEAEEAAGVSWDRRQQIRGQLNLFTAVRLHSSMSDAAPLAYDLLREHLGPVEANALIARSWMPYCIVKLGP